MADGCDQKKTSIHPSRVASSQPPRNTTATSNRSPATFNRRRCASRLRRAARSTGGRAAWSRALMRTLSCAAALLTFIAHQDLIPKVVPDLLVDLAKARLEADLGDVAGPRKVDLVVALDRAGTGGDDEDPVAQ